MPVILLDTETRSRADLPKTGVYRYAEDPDFALLLLGWSVDGGPVQHAEGEAIRDVVPELLAADLLVAHNAGFDRVVLGALDPRLQDPERWYCTQVAAAEDGWPQKLEDLAKAVGAEEKDTAGTRLINLFAKPNRNGGWNDKTTHPEQWEEFVDYLRQDVSTLVDVCRRIPQPTSGELELWRADQRVNDRGVRVDVDLIPLAIEADARNKSNALEEMRRLTGVDNPNSVAQLGKWLGVPSLAKDAVEKELETAAGDRRRVLELRQTIAGSAVKKFQAAADQTCRDGRARGQFRFFGAHTGRWAGKGIQLQNLPREHFDAVEDRDAALLRLRAGQGASPEELKALIRPMLLGPLTVVDFAQVESRVLAWLAGEQWVLDAYVENRDLYTETAAAMGPEFTRQQGKTAVLACGFGGSVGALRRMGAQGSDSELMPVVERYRAANPKIVRLWRDLWNGFLSSGSVGRVEFHNFCGDRRMQLPSGRSIVYRNVHQHDGDWWFHGGRGRTKLWHGIIAENVTQAVARDLLGAAILRVEAELGPVVVGHVHDELILEGHHDVERVMKLMCDPPAWADGLPLGAEGQVVDRYQK